MCTYTPPRGTPTSPPDAASCSPTQAAAACTAETLHTFLHTLPVSPPDCSGGREAAPGRRPNCTPPPPYSSHCSHSVSPPPAAAVAEQLRLVIALFEGLEKLSGNDYPAYLQVGVGSVGKVWTCHRRPPPAGPFRYDVQSPPPSMHTPLLHSRLCLHCVRVRSQPPQHVSPLQTMMKPLCDVLRRTPLHSTLCSHLPPPPPFTADHDEAAV